LSGDLWYKFNFVEKLIKNFSQKAFMKRYT